MASTTAKCAMNTPETHEYIRPLNPQKVPFIFTSSSQIQSDQNQEILHKSSATLVPVDNESDLKSNDNSALENADQIKSVKWGSPI